MTWFPDGNIYFIENGNMYRLYVNGTLDSKKWIGTSSDSYHVRESDQSLHRDAGTFYIHSNDNTFLVSGNILFQVYPTFKEINSTITQYQTGIVVGSKFYLSGTNKDLNNCFLTYDIESEDEQILLSAENIDIYQMDWSASQKTLFFSGLNFNGNKQVIGKFYPINSSVSLSNTGSSSKVNIGVFG
jgi:hypothetical protein